MFWGLGAQSLKNKSFIFVYIFSKWICVDWFIRILLLYV